jgi:hypothetical protein
MYCHQEVGDFVSYRAFDNGDFACWNCIVSDIVSKAEGVLDSADNTGCSGDLTVVSARAIDRLRGAIVNASRF